ncbi:MAG: ParB/RepB/Spo0J family partition protein [Pseudomonadales bacterium]|jgi:ParB family chromosome partitioning protein|nr:ParB/RepB/Spo0J family partition protein [Pseudomonadales bacterium]
MTSRKRGLGRGLDALLGSTRPPAERAEVPVDAPAAPQGEASDSSGETVAAGQGERLVRMPVECLRRGRYQPRREMDPDRLEELAASIRVQGVMQPIVARPIGPDSYEIIAGERRWRAAQLAGLDRVPVIVREVPDEAAVALALIENIQREDLNPVEEAIALQRLIDEFGLTQQAAADAVGKQRSTITNLLRLLRLTGAVRELLESGQIEMGHARALLTLEPDQQRSIAKEVVARGLSVRQTEALARRPTDPGRGPGPKRTVDPDVASLERRLSEQVGAPVAIQTGSGGGGRLVIRYSSLDELEGILAHIR